MTVLALWITAGSLAQAQLAITEVMPSASGPDFWELTNFGTNAIDLSSYTFADNTALPQSLPTQGLLIAPQESVVFFRSNPVSPVTESEFRKMWGLPEGRPVVLSFPKPGLSADRDSVLVFDSQGNLVDHVEFGLALYHFSFTSDTTTGAFGALSQAGICGAWVNADGDVGSPGTLGSCSTTDHPCGVVPFRIVEGPAPANLVVTPGMDAEFHVEAPGMPRPRYQWRFDGVPIPSATASVLHLANVQPQDAGAYDVLVTNGLCSLLSSPATLVVDTNPSPPVILVSPADRSAFANQSVCFSVGVSGYPKPALQWLSNGIPILEETNRMFCISGEQNQLSGSWEICVEARNSLGSTSACARLTVTRQPDLRITEVTGWPMTNALAREDWFELTNYDTNEVNLLGWLGCD